MILVLSNDELAVLIGSKAVQELHHHNTKKTQQDESHLIEKLAQSLKRIVR